MRDGNLRWCDKGQETVLQSGMLVINPFWCLFLSCHLWMFWPCGRNPPRWTSPSILLKWHDLSVERVDQVLSALWGLFSLECWTAAELSMASLLSRCKGFTYCVCFAWAKLFVVSVVKWDWMWMSESVLMCVLVCVCMCHKGWILQSCCSMYWQTIAAWGRFVM